MSMLDPTGNMTEDAVPLYPSVYLMQSPVFRSMLYIGAVLIIGLNLVVVVSSGLISRQGQEQRKCSYLLLGNVSLADTLIGFLILIGLHLDRQKNSTWLCAMNTGLIITPAVVSIYTISLIAIERYIYIMHGMRYHVWINTRRVHIAIAISWLTGLIIAFAPIVAGLLKNNSHKSTCWDLMFSSPITMIVTSILSMVPMLFICIPYGLILREALKQVDEINGYKSKDILKINDPSRENIYKAEANGSIFYVNMPTIDLNEKDEIVIQLENKDKQHKFSFDNEAFAVSNDDLGIPEVDLTLDNIDLKNTRNKKYNKCSDKKQRTVCSPCKRKAIKIIGLTTGALLITWFPFLLTKLVFASCELYKPGECSHLKDILATLLAPLAKSNSLFNPVLYAWWHPGFAKGFRKIMRTIKAKFQDLRERISQR